MLAHVVGIDDAVGTYVRAGGRIGTANARIAPSRPPARRAATSSSNGRGGGPRLPPPTSVPSPRCCSAISGVHHSDVLRGLGRKRLEVPPATAAAVLREGFVLGGPRAVRYRLVPDGRRAIGLPGRPVVRGTSEALGTWLAGRDSVADELQFGRHA